jgi:prepilin-type N-terminal cleavage/methylation domain-containing protein
MSRAMLVRNRSLRGCARGASIPGPRDAFTLVELMVALALAAMISVSIMFISSQARLAYDATVKKVNVYTLFRFALKAIETDIKGWIPSSDLEFYTDGRGKGGQVNGHWDPGEELPDTRDKEYGFGVVDGGTVGTYDEYARITEQHYVSRERGQTEDKIHDAYQVYFRTFTFVDGVNREANVEYMLVDRNYEQNNDGSAPDRGGKGPTTVPLPPRKVKPDSVPDLTLVKIVRYYDLRYQNLQKPNDTPIVRRVIDVCSNITDFKVEYLIDKDFRGKVSPGFRTPKQDFEKPSEMVTKPKQIPGLGGLGGYQKSFGYGTVKLGEKVEVATAYPAVRGDDNLSKGAGGEQVPVRFGFKGNSSISFAELTPGDQMFIFTPSSRGGAAAGQAAQTAGNGSKLLQFPSRDYTVKTNLDGLIEFEEDIDSTTWNGKPQTGVYYKAAFMPAAVRVTLRMVDEKGENPKTLQREIWLRRRSR